MINIIKKPPQASSWEKFIKTPEPDTVIMAFAFIMFIVITLFLSVQKSHSSSSVNMQQSPSPISTIDDKNHVNNNEGVFGAQEFYLDNGVRVIAVPNDRAPVTAHMVWYSAGALDDAFEYSGTAHFLEHLMFKGSENVAPGEFSRTVRRLGGRDNAFTSYDYTGFYQVTSSEHLPKMMKMEVDRIINLQVPEEEFASEHKVVIEERRQVTESDPKSVFREKMRQELYGSHPYGRPVIGHMEDIERIDKKTINEFREKYYRPKNITMIVSGDITAEKLQELAEKTYGQIPVKSKIKTKIQQSESENQSENESQGKSEASAKDLKDIKDVKHIEMCREDVFQPYMERIMIAPSLSDNIETSVALQVLVEAIAGGPSTRIYNSLAVEKKIAVNAGIYYQPYARDKGYMVFYATPVAGTDLSELEKEFDAELEEIAKGGITAEELISAQRILKAETIYAADSVLGPARIIGQAISTGASLEYVEDWQKTIENITLDQVNQLASEYFSPPYQGSITGYLLPKAEKQ